MTEPRPSAVPDDTASPDSVKFEWLEHIGLLVSAGTFALIAYQIYAVTGHDLTTATAVVQAGGVGNVALGSALASGRSVLGVVVQYMAAVFGERLAAGRVGRRHIPLAIAVGFVTINIIPTAFVILAIAFGFVSWAIDFFQRRNPRPDWQLYGSATAGEHLRLMIGLVFLPSLALLQVAWLPPEVFHPAGSEEAEVGYALEQREDGLVVLLRKPQPHVEVLKVAGLRRQLCSQSMWFQRPILQVLEDQRYPKCPS